MINDMTRLLVGEEWFDQVAPSALYETEYERVVFQQAPLLYPDYFMLPFNISVYSDTDVAKPDAVLISKTYRDWWVVEIEMAHHSLDSHVLPQVATLASGYYQDHHAEHICKQMASLDNDLVSDVIKGKPPRVLVIVNTPTPDWIQPLRRYNVSIAVFEIFRSRNNRHVFRVNGEYPVPPADVLSECYFDSSLPGFLVVSSPASLGVRHSQNIRIKYQGFLTEWTRIDSQARVWLVPARANPLPVNQVYELLGQEDGELVIRAKDHHSRG